MSRLLRRARSVLAAAPDAVPSIFSSQADLSGRPPALCAYDEDDEDEDGLSGDEDDEENEEDDEGGDEEEKWEVAG